MNAIIISINPIHVENIINGTKKYEYRTKVAKKDIDKIIIYSTYPVMKVIAVVDIIDIVKGTPSELWDMTKDHSGITKNFFDEYFQKREVAYAYKLGKVRKYEEPKALIDFGVKFAPQSFVYVNMDFIFKDENEKRNL